MLVDGYAVLVDGYEVLGYRSVSIPALTGETRSGSASIPVVRFVLVSMVNRR